MGHEYEGHFAAPLAETAVCALFDALATDGRWRLVRRDARELTLAYADEPHNPAWPESIVVQPSESSIYVLFHGGTDAQFRDLLDMVTRTLESLGAACVIDEL